MMKTLYTYKAKISDVVKPEAPLPDGQDQTFVCTLFGNGSLSIKFYGGEKDSLVSRISLPLKSSAAVEVFTEPGKDYWLMRVNGNQVPLILPLDECEKLMTAIDGIV